MLPSLNSFDRIEVFERYDGHGDDIIQQKSKCTKEDWYLLAMTSVQQQYHTAKHRYVFGVNKKNKDILIE